MSAIIRGMLAGALALLLLLQASADVKDIAALIAAGRLDEASAKLEAADPNTPGVLRLKGVVEFNRKQYRKAADTLTAAIAKEREGSPAWRESAAIIGQSEFLLNRFAEAVPWLEKARTPGNSVAEITYMLGVSNIHLLRPEEARRAIATLFSVAPESAAAHLLTARMMYRLEYAQQAEPLLRKALELEPKLPGAHQILGEMATFRNDTATAVSELKAELAVNPDSALAWYKLGDAYSRTEDWVGAVAALQRSIWLSPFNSGPYILLGKAYVRQQQFAAAEGMLRRALQMDPNNGSAHYLLGQTLMRTGRTEEGRAELKRGQELGGSR